MSKLQLACCLKSDPGSGFGPSKRDELPANKPRPSQITQAAPVANPCSTASRAPPGTPPLMIASRTVVRLHRILCAGARRANLGPVPHWLPESPRMVLRTSPMSWLNDSRKYRVTASLRPASAMLRHQSGNAEVMRPLQSRAPHSQATLPLVAGCCSCSRSVGSGNQISSDAPGSTRMVGETHS